MVEFAGLDARLLAGFVDATIALVFFLVVGGINAWTSVRFILDDNVSFIWTVTIVIFLSSSGAIYIVISEVVGKSFGKRFARIRVVRADDWRPPGVIVGLLRTAAKLLTVGTLGLGLLLIVFDQRRRALHDRASDTFVVYG
jgi:uncharacterized RDD family membrane protein YckC